MKYWDEFDHIKTPESWKKIPLQKEPQNHFRFSFMVAMIIIMISISGAIAYHDTIKEWLTSYFQEENIYQTDQVIKTKNHHYIFSYPFCYQQDNQDNVLQVYLIKNHQLQPMKSQTMKGYYNQKPYSFEYVIHDHSVLTFHHKGSIEYSLTYIDQQTMYVMTSDNNLASLNLKTGEIQTLTNDHQSVNPIISPNGKTILINKNDDYWTVYDVETKIEKKVEGIAGYAHSNEIYFIDDDHILTYTDTATIQIDLKTMEKTKYDIITEFASPIALQINDESIEIDNILTNEHCEMKGFFNGCTYMTRNYLLLYDVDHCYLYSIEKNRYIEMIMPKDVIDIIDIVMIDEEHELLIYNEEYCYFVDISILFDE